MGTTKAFLEGFELLRPHIKDAFALNAEHDVIYVLTEFTALSNTPADLQINLRSHGWHWSNEGDCWAFYT